MASETLARFHAAATFARTRRAPALLSIVIGLGLLTLWIGLRASQVPTADDANPTPFWRMFVLGVAILPATGLHSPLHTLEEAAAAAHRNVERRYLWTLWLASAGLYLALVLPATDLPLLAIMGRCLLAWSGLALISGRVFGWRLSWVLPLGALLPLTYWGGDPAGYWWDFTARPIDHAPSLVLSAALLSIGAVAYETTAWWRPSTPRRPTPRGGAARRWA